MAKLGYECPVCRKRSSTKQGILMHFYRALDGLGTSPSRHIEWARNRGISLEGALFGGPQDSEGLPAGDLVSLKAVLYKYFEERTEKKIGDNWRGPNTIHFGVDAGLLLELGERLVARRSIALAELIKNAYDADSTQVTVRFENVTRPGGTITVEDNGNGMTFEQLEQGWMRIATDQARRQAISPRFGRPRTGAKGIGRFACMRLSRNAILHSVGRLGNGRPEIIEAVFDWEDFKPGENLETVGISLRKRIGSQATPTGVKLSLRNARDVWDKDDIAALQRDLLELVSPFPLSVSERTGDEEYEPDPGFSIRFETPEFPKYEGELGEQFLAAAWGVLAGVITEQGRPEYTLKVRGGRSFTFQPSELIFGSLGGATCQIHYFVYAGEYFRGLDFRLGDARAVGRERGGVRIYLDRFRVFPYGDPGDDWLGLDADRARRVTLTPDELLPTAEGLERPMLALPGNMQLFGSVSISRLTNPAISVNISRERLVENEAFSELRKFVRLGIDWTTIQYARAKAEENRQRRTREGVSAPTIFQALAAIRETVIQTAGQLAPETRAEIVQAVDLAEEMARSEEEERISQLSMLRILASAGAMVMIFDHTLRALVSGVGQIHTDLSELRPQVSTQVCEAYDNLLNRLDRWREAVEHQALQVGLLLGREARERRRRLALRPVVDELSNAFKQYMQEYGIDLSNEVPAHLRTPPLFQAELHSILLNLLTNALKAVRTQRSRRIQVAARREDGSLHIIMCDTGVGLDPSLRQEVFEPFVTTSVPDPILGVGTGLGLKIVRDLVAVYGGEARFIDTEAPWKTGVEVILPEG